jgi:hypothetical protein
MISDSRDRPGAPAAATVAVLASFLVGVGALGASSVLSSAAPRVLLAAVLTVTGWAIARRAADDYSSLADALGDRVLRGTGTSLAVLGAYLLGLALLTASDAPSPTTVILLVYGTPALALLAAATTTGMRVWAVGAGAILPMLAVLLLATAEVSAGPVSVTMLVTAALLAAVALYAPASSRWADLTSAAAAMSASFAFGAGTSPFGSLGTTQLGGTPGEGMSGGLTGGAQAAVAGAALLVAVVVLIAAVLRRDVASGLLVGAVFAMPPVLLRTDAMFGAWQPEVRVVLVAVPALVALVGLAALRSYRFRRTLVSIFPTLHEDPPAASATSTKPHPTTEPPSTEPTPTQPDSASQMGSATQPNSTIEPASVTRPASMTRPGSVTQPVSAAEPGSMTQAASPAEQDSATRQFSATEPDSAARSGSTVEPEPATRQSSATELDPPGSAAEPGWAMRPAPPTDADSPTSSRPGTRPALDPHEPANSDATTAAACAVLVAAAAVVFVTLAMPVFAWDLRVQGAVALVVLVGTSALAYWLPGTPGATAAVIALLGLALASPRVRLLTGGALDPTTFEQIAIGVIDLLAAAALVWFLTRRHPRVGVYAAAAYLLAGSIAAFIGAFLFNAGYFSGGGIPFGDDWQPVLIVSLPLLLLAIPAAVLAFGPRAAAAQAVGAVALAAGGFLPLKVMVAQFSNATTGFALQASLAPLTPTDWLATSSVLRSVSGTAMAAVIAMVLVALVLAASLARRPSAPLAASITLLLLSAVQASLLTALAEWSTDEAESLGWALGTGALVAALVAVAVGLVAARRGAPAR